MKKLFITAIVFLTFLSSALSPINKSFATGSLVGYWKLDETTQGSNAADSSGTNTGIPQGTDGGPNPSINIPSSITFSDTRSASFNGTDQYYNCGDIPTNLPTGSSARSITAWIKGDSFADSYGKSIAGWGRDSGGELSELRINTTGQLEFHGNGNDIAGSSILSTGQWYFVAATVTDGGAVTIYVNGTQDGTGTVTLNTPATNCKIGKQPDFNGQYFDGLIDDVRFYNTALTSTQIGNLADGNQDPDPSPTSTPTPSPGSGSNNNSGSSSSDSPPCTNSVPGTANLFQINANKTHATLFFAPASGNITNYAISYGYTSNDERFSTFTNQGESTGVLVYTVNDLSPHLSYYFKVRSYNGCMPGIWSNEMKITTTKNSNIAVSYYKDFPSQIFSIFPKKISELTVAQNRIQNAGVCEEYTVQPGDSLWQIAEEKLGSGSKYPIIQSVNLLSTTMINPGQKLKVGC